MKEDLERHQQQYLTDSKAAHYWDLIGIGTPGGPVSYLLLRHLGRTQ